MASDISPAPVPPARAGRLPVTVVTGFLGAGKTTLLRHLLLESGQRLAVIVNEFGDVGIDGDLIAACGFCPEEERGDRLVELTNGCLCCTVQDDFLPTMERLLERREQLDGIVVETSGLALPAPLVAAFGWPAIRPRVRVQGVVTVVDGEALAAGHVVGDADAVEAQRRADPSLDHISALEELFADQLEAADLVLVSRADRVAGEALDGVIARIRSRLRPGTGVLAMQRGRIDPALVLDAPQLDVHPHGAAGHSPHGSVTAERQPGTSRALEDGPQSGDASPAPPEPDGDQRTGSHASPLAGEHPHGHDHDQGSDHPTARDHGEAHGHAGHPGHDQGLAHGHGHDDDEHEHDHAHRHADIASVVLRRTGHWQRETLEPWLALLIRDHPVLRLKGRLLQPDKPLPLQIQAVGPRLECWYEQGPASDSRAASLELVLLTPASQQEALRQRLEDLPAPRP